MDSRGRQAVPAWRSWLCGIVLVTLAVTLAAGQAVPPISAPPTVACGGCHTVPPPDVLPRAAWADNVLHMQRIRDGSEATATPTGTLPTDMLAALAWYERHAPRALAPPVDWPAAVSSSFIVRGLSPPGAPPTPVVADVTLADLDGDARLELIVCDMRHGMVLLGRPYDPTAGLTLIAKMAHPSRAQVAALATDLNGDGDQDILLANGDTFDDSLLKPHHGLAWLERKTKRLGLDAFAPHRLAALPGPHAIVAADIDGDGDGDGDMDIVTGNMATTGPIPSWVDVWENPTRTRQHKRSGDQE